MSRSCPLRASDHAVLQGARTFGEAQQIAASIAKSPLVKTALFGGDANWGRILCAVGYSGVPISPEKVRSQSLPLLPEGLFALQVDLWLLPPAGARELPAVHLVRAGQPYDPEGTNVERATALFRLPELHVRVELGLGDASATYWTCDLRSAPTSLLCALLTVFLLLLPLPVSITSRSTLTTAADP